MSFHSGFVCILGRPNAGKSTLLNALVGEKLAIISPKPQTTRNRILGIINVPKQKGKESGQIMLVDTPGVHRSGSSLGRKMMGEVREAIEGCDLMLKKEGDQFTGGTVGRGCIDIRDGGARYVEYLSTLEQVVRDAARGTKEAPASTTANSLTPSRA